MLLNHYHIEGLLKRGVVRFSLPEFINGTSLDVRLGHNVLVETRPSKTGLINFSEREPLAMEERLLSEAEPLYLLPGQFILAHTIEEFHMPDDLSAEYKLKSSMARCGLQHLNAGWCDPGWRGSNLTLELMNVTNHHTIILRPGDRIGQLVFFAHEAVEPRMSYKKRGRYNNDKGVSGIKP